jgi:hypothetical protein
LLQRASARRVGNSANSFVGVPAVRVMRKSVAGTVLARPAKMRDALARRLLLVFRNE